MRIIVSYSINSIVITWLFFITLSCNNTSSNKRDTNPVNPVNTTRIITKSASTYPDTLKINFPAAVFCHPDSLQLLKIKKQTDSMVFDGSMHEYFYQMGNARIVIKRAWPGLKIVEAKNYRYLLFIKKDNTHELVDLDTKNDAYGLVVFNEKKEPLFVDMTNIETEVSFYLK